MVKYSREWFLAEHEKVKPLEMLIYHYNNNNIKKPIWYVHFYYKKDGYDHYHNDAGPASYIFSGSAEPDKFYYINNVYVGQNLNIFSKEELQNYLLL